MVHLQKVNPDPDLTVVTAGTCRTQYGKPQKSCSYDFNTNNTIQDGKYSTYNVISIS